MLGYVRGYLFSNTKAGFWIDCKCEIPTYIFYERPGVKILWNNTDKLTGMEQNK